LPAISKMVLCSHSQFVNFQHVFHCDLGRHDLNAHNFRSVSHGSSWKPFRSLFFLWHYHQNLCWTFVSNAVY
jgi:hypothetical protein